MKRVAAMLLIAGCGCAQADVYKWTDERGEVHYGEHPPAAATAAEKVMTQEQLERAQDAGQAVPPPGQAGGDADSIHQAVQRQQEECERYQSLKAEFIRDAAANPRSEWTPLMGYGVGYVLRDEALNRDRVIDYGEIEANIRKYCQ